MSREGDKRMQSQWVSVDWSLQPWLDGAKAPRVYIVRDNSCSVKSLYAPLLTTLINKACSKRVHSLHNPVDTHSKSNNWRLENPTTLLPHQIEGPNKLTLCTCKQTDLPSCTQLACNHHRHRMWTITAAVWNTPQDMVSVEHTHPICLESLPLKPL
jgi:hypothetical protein